jgi:small subunit ribosomal protein S8
MRDAMLLDPLANALSKIQNAERARKKEVTISPVSKLVREVIEIMQREGFVESFELIDEGKSFRVALHGRTNACGVIKPRYSTKRDGYEKWEKRFLPSTGLGLLIVSTPQGVMTHREALERELGGKLLAYIF